MPAKRAIQIKQVVKAPPREVYRAFTNSTALREWFCDAAQADPVKGGRLYAWWNGGFYGTGEYLSAKPDKQVAFTWFGRGEPGPTRVQVRLRVRKGGTEVALAHSGLGSGKKWTAAAKEFERSWKTGLENMASVLETGEDLRFVMRPMLGIMFDEYNAEIAARLVAPAEGVRLSGTVEAMGARAAGLQNDDVIVSLGGRKVKGYPTLISALQRRRAGDRVKVVFFRGGEKKTVEMELSRRPMPAIPPTAQELAEAVRKVYEEGDRELAACFEGVTEAEASHSPAPADWSAKEVLAHLVHGERDNQLWIADLVSGHERWYDGGSNVHARNQATVAVLPTVGALMDEFKRSEEETLALLRALPPEFVARKGSYWRLAHNYLQGISHTHEHAAQIRAAIQAVR